MKNILIEQNLHWSGKKQSFVKRTQLNRLIKYLPLKQIITITGIRRCGKSTLAKQAIWYLVEDGVPANNILFVNLEQPYFLEYKHNPSYLNTIYEEYLKLMNPEGKIYIVFDEIQFFDNWQVYIKSKYESSEIKFILTGSNSSMLSNELNTLLSGRSLNIHLDTFSFGEFLDFKNIEHKNEFDRVKNRIDIQRAKDEYMKWGGFYEVFETNDESIKKDILINYAKNIIYQDIVPRHNIRNSEALERLFFYLLLNVAGVLNYTTLSKIFGISDKSIKEYINYFEDVFLLKRVDKFHNKQKEQIKSSKKIYALDNGFLQISPKHSSNSGASLENLVFNVLNSQTLHVTYLKDIYEVDFYTKDTMYQVSYDISKDKTKNREINAFEYFEKNKKINKILITYDVNEKVENVEIVSIDEFMLR